VLMDHLHIPIYCLCWKFNICSYQTTLY